MKTITFTTDFGIKSNYPSQMKAVILTITPDAKLVDITHNISRHNIIEGAYVLMTTVPYFPKGTVHVAIVDPGVGSLRRGIVIVTKTQILVGPDNGLLIPVANKLSPFQVYEIENQNLMLNKISNVFHGRDVFAPVASYILNGVLFEEIGQIIHDYIDLNIEKIKITQKNVTGKILYIDDFGNIITNIKTNHLINNLDKDKKLMVFVGKNKKTIPFVKTYHDIKKGCFLITNSSSGFLEISANQSKASERLKIKLGDEIKIKFS